MDRWNHNIHHHPLVLRAVRPGYRRALDVGCGEGVLTRELRARLPAVTGIDPDDPGRARAAVIVVCGAIATTVSPLHRNR